ncbi:unnamed protein product [Pedinophyceae sp. YPF-701]|nr:unnamed protein product [Pedinophyceae sp. YPF-701]
MDLHHQLRRNPKWARDGCNICGERGHQAASCPNGNINWSERWGTLRSKVFRLDPPLYFSEEVKRRAKYIDVEQVAKKARVFVEERLQDSNWDGPTEEEVAKTAAKSLAMSEADIAKQAEELGAKEEERIQILDELIEQERERKRAHRAERAVEDAAAPTTPAAAAPTPTPAAAAPAAYGAPGQQAMPAQGAAPQPVQQQPQPMQQQQLPPAPTPAAAPPAEQPLPEGWAEAKAPNGKTYYYEKATRKTQWTRPTA